MNGLDAINIFEHMFQLTANLKITGYPFYRTQQLRSSEPHPWSVTPMDHMTKYYRYIVSKE